MTPMAKSVITPQRNQLLAALPAEKWDRLHPHLKLRSMPLDHVLYEPDAKRQHAYFPIDSIISLTLTLADGRTAEIGMVGKEGFIGSAIIMDAKCAPRRAVVQSAGHAYRLRANYLKEEFTREVALQHLLLRSTEALMAQIAQTAVCNRLHSVEQRLCRWLLMSIDRLPSDELAMTQERIANMLGVRREGVTDSARKLRKLGLINYHRGRIVVLDRPAIEAHSCECYQVVKTECDRLLPRRRRIDARRGH